MTTEKRQPQTIKQKIASAVNWHLHQVMGAAGNICITRCLSNFGIIPSDFSSEQRAALLSLRERDVLIRNLLKQQEQELRNFHKLPKKEEQK